VDSTEEQDKPFVVNIKFNNENDLNEFLASVQDTLNDKYHASVNVAGGGL